LQPSGEDHEWYVRTVNDHVKQQPRERRRQWWLQSALSGWRTTLHSNCGEAAVLEVQGAWAHDAKTKAATQLWNRTASVIVNGRAILRPGCFSMGRARRYLDQRRRKGPCSWARDSQAQRGCHHHQIRNGVGLHLSYHLASVSLHRNLADPKFGTDLLVQEAGDDECHDFTFARCEQCVAGHQ